MLSAAGPFWYLRKKIKTHRLVFCSFVPPNIHHEYPVSTSKSDARAARMKRTQDETGTVSGITLEVTKFSHGVKALCSTHSSVDASREVSVIMQFCLNNIQIACPVIMDDKVNDKAEYRLSMGHVLARSLGEGIGGWRSLTIARR